MFSDATGTAPGAAAPRIAVVGLGISGLSCAFYLSGYDCGVTVFEQAATPGGRANTTPDGEHCLRIFLSDSRELFGILAAIRGEDGQNVLAALKRIRRFCRTPIRGWIEVSHLYEILAPEIPLWERLELVLARRGSPLLAEATGPERVAT